MQRYAVVLQELRSEVLRHNSYAASVTTPTAGGTVGRRNTIHGDENGNINGFGAQNGETTMNFPEAELGDMLSGQSPGFSLDGGLAHITGWGQLDALVGSIYLVTAYILTNLGHGRHRTSGSVFG